MGHLSCQLEGYIISLHHPKLTYFAPTKFGNKWKDSCQEWSWTPFDLSKSTWDEGYNRILIHSPMDLWPKALNLKGQTKMDKTIHWEKIFDCEITYLLFVQVVRKVTNKFWGWYLLCSSNIFFNCPYPIACRPGLTAPQPS